MMLLKARVTASGLNAGKLAARLGQGEIRTWNVRLRENQISLLCDIKDSARIVEIAQERGFKTEAPVPVGVAALLFSAKGRITLLIGLVVFALLVSMVMTRVWRIEIVDAGEYAGEVRLALDELKIHPLMSRAEVNLNQLREKLEWRLPSVKWVQVYYSGVNMVVKVVSGTAAGEAVTVAGFGDVVASEDGIIASILTFAGTPRVLPGDVVKKGQVLIEGIERGTKETPVMVKACGTVTARVFLRAAVRVPLTEVISYKTGREQARRVIQLPFFRYETAKQPDYLTYDVEITCQPLGGAFLPAVLIREKYMEAALEKQTRQVEAVKREAGVAALRKLNKTVGFLDEIIDKWLDYSMIEGDKVEAIATAEIRREIGRYVQRERQ